MSFFDDRLGKLIDTVTEMRESYLTMSANFKNLESSYEKFVEYTDKKIDKMSDENEDIRRRLTSIEGSFDSIIKSSTKEAIINLVREKFKNDGELPENSEELKKLLDKKDTTE